MQSNKIPVNNKGKGLLKVLNETENYAAREGYEGKYALHLRLLAEESLNMLRSLTGTFRGEFWIESRSNQCVMTIQATAEEKKKKKSELLALSKSGDNLMEKGVFNKIRAVFESFAYNIEKSENWALIKEGMDLMPYDETLANDPLYFGSAGISQSQIWSLQKYKEKMKHQATENPKARQAWDELEKSIVANIASDVQVGVAGDKVKLVIIADFPKTGSSGK